LNGGKDPVCKIRDNISVKSFDWTHVSHIFQNIY